MSEPSLLKKLKQISLFGGIILFSITAVTLFFGAALNTPPYLIIKSFIKQGYLLHHNYTLPPVAFGLNFNSYVYFVFFVATVLALSFRKYISGEFELNSQQSILIIGIILFLLTSLNHLNNLIYYYKFEKKLFAGKSLAERNANLFDGLAFRFSQFCHQHISGHQNAKLITDMNINRDPGMLAHRMMAYYLYPIDIRNVRRKEPDYLLFFMKKNAREFVPDDFRVIAEINDKYLIAERK